MGDLAERWGDRCGLAPVALFAQGEQSGGTHHILLDGGLGSFAFSETTERLWRDPKAAAWAWSSGVPHHVTVTPKEVAVVRWDKPGAEEFSRQSVENGLDAFYSYLVADRVQSTRRVVEHLVDVFRRTRSLVQETAGDNAAIRAYLGILATAINRTRDGKPVPVPDQDLLKSLRETTVDNLVSQAISAASSLSRSDIKLLPELAVRHAGSEIFQEAHFELESIGSTDLFDWISPATSSKKTRGTSHFTPPALARSLVEQTFKELGKIEALQQLTVLDPAVGSGSFLYEAFRTARRHGFEGKLKLVGRDLSAAAVDMARFILSFASEDWTPAGGLELDLQVADALDGELPKADAVLMNPPFMAWTMMTQAQRSQMKDILGDTAKGRVDLAMAFVSRALDAVRPGGAIGSIMPASVLASSAAEPWRSSIRKFADLRMVASLGEYGLFAHAAVNVAAIVATRRSGDERDNRDVTAVIGGRTAEATGNALRAIRGAERIPASTGDERWQVFPVPQAAFDEFPTWRPIDPGLRNALARSEALGLTRPLGEVFEVLQGARTGWVKGFVLDQSSFSALDRKEQRYFRPAAMGDNVINGTIQKDSFVFFPYNDDGPLIRTEEELQRSLPTYYKQYLLPQRDMLSRRMTHVERADWWTLARPRGWNTSRRPRIVSKYFGGIGGFALDPDGTFVVVQGFAWFLQTQAEIPADPAVDSVEEEGEVADLGYAEAIGEAVAISEDELLHAYLAFFNSITFEKLLATFSSHVAGGQYDLSWRFVRTIPVPDFATLWQGENHASEIAHLAELGRSLEPDSRRWTNSVNRLAAEFYGTELSNLL